MAENQKDLQWIKTKHHYFNMKYQTVKSIIKNNVDVLDYVILSNISNNVEWDFSDSDFSENISRLRDNKYISLNNKLTIEGKQFLLSLEREVLSTDYYSNLHKKLQDKLFELTGKKQKMLMGKYYFLCGKEDLRYKLEGVIKKYKLEDKNKIEDILVKYVERCHKAGWDKVHLIEYYISKYNTSKLVTDYENYEEQQLEKEVDNAVNI